MHVGKLPLPSEVWELRRPLVDVVVAQWLLEPRDAEGLEAGLGAVTAAVGGGVSAMVTTWRDVSVADSGR
jgi:hypothetical protein